jgi:predicted O-methyltransferase YrrM
MESFMLIIRKKIGEARRRAKTCFSDYSFCRALHQIALVPQGKLPTRSLMQQLWAGWGNQSYSGHPEYLDEVVKRATTISGPVLECGSGLSTLLLGLFAARRGIQVWTLEHDPEWYEHTATALRRFGIEGVGLVLAPLRSYGDFSWYDVPLEKMPLRFDMVVCDGPPQKTTPGDRYGLLPVMRERLGPGSVILLDDVLTHGPDPVLTRWLGETTALYQVVASRASDTYAVIRLR